MRAIASAWNRSDRAVVMVYYPVTVKREKKRAFGQPGTSLIVD
jgi:hypothetical protein